MCLIIVWKI